MTPKSTRGFANKHLQYTGKNETPKGDIPKGMRCSFWNPGGTLVEPWWNSGGTLVELWWNPGGTLVEPWWNRPGPPGAYLG